jgi:hypothetical protein
VAYIEWEDSDGTGVLTPSYPNGPARRFRNWTPAVVPVGPARYALGTGRRFLYEHRRDYRASFEVPGLKPTQHALVHRFVLHALKGCAFFVYTEDKNAATYECRLAEDGEPEYTFEDTQQLEYTVRVTVKNLAAAPMLCDYTGGA